MYRSADGGTTWNQLTSAPTSKAWSYISSSGNGTILAAVTSASSEYIYFSFNSGANWTGQARRYNGMDGPAMTQSWSSVTISSDGVGTAAMTSGGTIRTSWIPNWTSQNLGFWYPVSPAIQNWTCIAPLGPGTGDYVAVASGGNIWISSGAGATWTKTSAPTGDWKSVAVSSNGQKIVAARTDGGGVWTSANKGSTWTQTTAVSWKTWRSVSSSSDGTILFAANRPSNGAGGSLFKSTDSGSTWVEKYLTLSPTASPSPSRSPSPQVKGMRIEFEALYLTL